jgi:hypothetical protein
MLVSRRSSPAYEVISSALYAEKLASPLREASANFGLSLERSIHCGNMISLRTFKR